ncbi:MAG: IS5 family transposase [bacterium]|nr:IS5 family transposase [bacterium]
MTTSKSPLSVTVWAYAIAKESLPAYSCEKSNHIYTQHQLFALLILKQFFQEDYRGLVEVIKDFSDIRKILYLEIIPHYTTLQKASKRLLSSKKVQKLLKTTIQAAQNIEILKKKSSISALDSTGMEAGHTSRYFVKRRERGEKNLYQTTIYKTFPKLALNCDCESHIITGLLTSKGPSPDVVHFKKLLHQANDNLPIETITADAGYDSEANHEYARDLNIYSVINPKAGRPTTKLPSGKYRREMVEHFDTNTYGQRWQSETVMSMLKRNLSESILSKKYWSQCREMALKVLTHNITIVLPG